MEIIFGVGLITVVAFLFHYFCAYAPHCSSVNENYTLSKVECTKFDNISNTFKTDVITNLYDEDGLDINLLNRKNNIFETDKIIFSFKENKHSMDIFFMNKGYYNLEVKNHSVTFVVNNKCIENYSGGSRVRLPFKAEIDLNYNTIRNCCGMYFDAKLSKNGIDKICKTLKIGESVRLDIPIYDNDKATNYIYSFYFTLENRNITPIKGRAKISELYG